MTSRYADQETIGRDKVTNAGSQTKKRTFKNKRLLERLRVLVIVIKILCSQRLRVLVIVIKILLPKLSFFTAGSLDNNNTYFGYLGD